MSQLPKKKRRAIQPAPRTTVVAPGPIEIPADYTAVVAAASLLQIRLVKQHFSLDPAFFADSSPSLSYGRNVMAHQFDDGTSTTVLEWWLHAEHADVLVLECRAQWLVAYENLKSCEAEAVFEFAQRVGGLASYPYFRTTCAQLIWSAGVSLPPLPTVRAGEFPPISLDELRRLRQARKAPKKPVSTAG